jgi:hypothetical protein
MFDWFNFAFYEPIRICIAVWAGQEELFYRPYLDAPVVVARDAWINVLDDAVDLNIVGERVKSPNARELATRLTCAAEYAKWREAARVAIIRDHSAAPLCRSGSM